MSELRRPTSPQQLLRHACLAIAVSLIAGCPLMPPTQRVRISLDVPEATMENVTIGGVEYGTVEYGVTTDYLQIQGRVVNSITIGPDQTQVGTVTLQGFVRPGWTLHVDGSLDWLRFTLQEDG